MFKTPFLGTPSVPLTWTYDVGPITFGLMTVEHMIFEQMTLDRC